MKMAELLPMLFSLVYPFTLRNSVKLSLMLFDFISFFNYFISNISCLCMLGFWLQISEFMTGKFYFFLSHLP